VGPHNLIGLHLSNRSCVFLNWKMDLLRWCSMLLCNIWKSSGFERSHMIQVVVATSSGNPAAVRVFAGGSVQFRSSPGQKPEPRCLGGVVSRTRHSPVAFWPGWSRPTVPNTRFQPLWLQIKYLSYDCIVIWSVCRLCSFMPSFTSRSQICDPTNIRKIAVI